MHGAVERQLVARPLGGLLGVGRAALRLARVEPMVDDCLAVHVGLGLVRHRETAMVGPRLVARQAGDHGLANAVVARLDELAAVAHAQANEAPLPQLAQQRVEALARGRGALQDRHRHRAPVRGDQLEEAPRLGVDSLKALADQIVERGARVAGDLARARGLALLPHASREILDEERAAAGFLRDDVGDAARVGVVRAEHVERHTAGVVEGERVDGHVAHVQTLDDVLLPVAEEGARLRLRTVAVSEHEHGRGRVRGPHHVEEQSGAVDVAPLHVVDVHDDGAEARQPRQDLPERAARALAQLVRIVRGARRHRRDRREPPQHREDVRQRPRVAGRETSSPR